jgi:hypothetical protein
MFLVERFLKFFVDHIIGRGNHIAQGTDVSQVIAESAKRLDIGHDLGYLTCIRFVELFRRDAPSLHKRNATEQNGKEAIIARGRLSSSSVLPA